MLAGEVRRGSAFFTSYAEWAEKAKLSQKFEVSKKYICTECSKLKE